MSAILAPEKAKHIKMLSGFHLTATQKTIITALLSKKQLSGGTKRIQMEMKPTGEKNTYIVQIWERYAIASRSFDTRPESQIVKWHHTQTVKIEVKP